MFHTHRLRRRAGIRHRRESLIVATWIAARPNQIRAAIRGLDAVVPPTSAAVGARDACGIGPTIHLDGSGAWGTDHQTDDDPKDTVGTADTTIQGVNARGISELSAAAR